MTVRAAWAGLQTATDIYRRGDRTVVVLGVSHIASQAFWDQINQSLTEFEARGYEVHYEAVKTDIPNPPPMPLPVQEVAAVLGLVYQTDTTGMRKPPEHWLNTDMPLSEFLSHADPVKLQEAYDDDGTKGQEVMAMLREYPFARRVLRFLLTRALPILSRYNEGGALGVQKAIIIDARNHIAVAAAVQATGNVVTVWGAAHLRGIRERLEAAGFTHEGRSWTTSIPANRKPKHSHR